MSYGREKQIRTYSFVRSSEITFFRAASVSFCHRFVTYEERSKK